MNIKELIAKLEILATVKRGKLDICYYDPEFDKLIEIQYLHRVKAKDNTINKEVVVLTGEGFDVSKFKLIRKINNEER